MLKVTINPTYTHSLGFMREISWSVRGEDWSMKITTNARNARQVLSQLIAEYGSVTVVREPQGNHWKV